MRVYRKIGETMLGLEMFRSFRDDGFVDESRDVYALAVSSSAAPAEPAS